jgi:hypothetical protein
MVIGSQAASDYALFRRWNCWPGNWHFSPGAMPPRAWRSESKAISRRVAQVLFPTQIPFCGLDGRMPQGVFYLLDWSPAAACETGKSSAAVMWSYVKPELGCMAPDGYENGLGREGLAQHNPL